MTSQGDPPRLKDMNEDVPGALVTALCDVRGAPPEAGELDAVKRRVWGTLGFVLGSSPPAHGPQVHGPAAIGVVGGAAGAKGVLAVALPWFAAPVGVAVVTGAVMLGVTGGGKPPDVRRASPSATAAVVPPNVAVTPALAPRPVEPSVEVAATDQLPPLREVATAPRAQPGVTRAAPKSKEAPAAAGAIGGPAVPPPSAPESELSLLARAQASLASDPARALSITDEHVQRFGSGALSQEREVIAVGALVRLGRMAEARARAERFHALYPTSAHGRRIDVLLGSP